MAAAGAGLAAGIIGGISSLMSGSAAARQGRAAERYSREQAERERRLAEMEALDFGRRQSAVYAERRAALGGSGIQTTTGTPVLTAEDFAAEVELQKQRIRAGGQVRASRLEEEGHLLRMQGRNAQQAGFFRAGSSLLGGYADYKRLS